MQDKSREGIEIFLFRHGMTEANENHLYCGKSDPDLSERGISLIKERLSSKNGTFLPDISHCKILTSPSKRCIQTLKLLYPEEAARKEVLSDFQEIDFGDFEMKSYQELTKNPLYLKWLAGEVGRMEDKSLENPCPKGESWQNMQNRVISALRQALEDIKNPDSTYYSLAIFTHGGPISAIMEYLFPEEEKNIYQWQPDFASGYKIVLDQSLKGGKYYEL